MPAAETTLARRVVVRTIVWLQKCRALLVGSDKKAINYLGLIQLACALTLFIQARVDPDR